MLDCENKKEIDSMTTKWSEQLLSVQEKHGESISSIQTQAEKCLENDYLVDEQTGLTPKKRVIVVPSHTSIEEMRTQISEKEDENYSEKRSKWLQADSKIPRLTTVVASPNRTPFADVN